MSEVNGGKSLLHSRGDVGSADRGVSCFVNQGGVANYPSAPLGHLPYFAGEAV